MCRQAFDMKTNYSFSYWAGVDQQNLWLTGAIFVLECIQASLSKRSTDLWVPYGTLFILTIPFLAYPISTYDFYCAHIIWKSLGFRIFELTMVPDQAAQLKMVIAALHWFVFYLVHLIQCQREWRLPWPRDRYRRRFDVLFPYAISREIHYIERQTV
jgi:hypothetical protein